MKRLSLHVAGSLRCGHHHEVAPLTSASIHLPLGASRQRCAMSSLPHSRLLSTLSVSCALCDCLICLSQAVDDSLVSATSSAAITSSEGKPTDVVKPRRGQYRRIGRRRVLALVHLVVRHGVLQLVAAQMRFELCAGLWAAPMASSASGVMRGRYQRGLGAGRSMTRPQRSGRAGTRSA